MKVLKRDLLADISDGRLQGFRYFPPHDGPATPEHAIAMLGVASLDSFEKKDLYFSIMLELRKRGYGILAAGNRELLAATDYAKYYSLIRGGDTATGATREESPSESPGAGGFRVKRILGKYSRKFRPDLRRVRSKVKAVALAVRPVFYLTQWYVPALTLAAKDADVPTALWCMDDPMIIEENWFYGDWFAYATEFDFVFSVSKGALPVYRNSGSKVTEWLPLYYDREVYTEADPCESVYPVSFVGNYFRDRQPACERILYPLVQHSPGMVHIFGAGWERAPQGAVVHGPVPRTKLPGVFSCSKVNVNLHREPAYRYAPAANFRTFEIPGAGGFELVEYMRGLEELFVLGKELVAVHDSREAQELTEYYADNEDERLRIAESGFDRVTKDHMLSVRMDKLMRRTGIPLTVKGNE